MSKKVRNRLPDGKRKGAQAKAAPIKRSGGWVGLIVVGLFIAGIVIYGLYQS